MSLIFLHGTPLASLEDQMRMVPNFVPRRHGKRSSRSYHPTAADVDCQYCLHYRYKTCLSRTCPYLAERLEAGAVTLAELTAETVRAWRYIPLRRRAMSVTRRTDSIHLEGQLHVARMVDAWNGTCWPSIRTIAGELKLSRATVHRALDDLCQAGFLVREERWRENGGRTSNLYKIV